MKLRNKKTGEVIDLGKGLIMDAMSGREIILKATCTTYGEVFRYRSLAELNKEWEDYKPAEPLIKDEKIRKAVRAWAEACGVSKVMVAHPNVGTTTLASISNPYKISFSNKRAFLPMGKEYSIDELCGDAPEYIEVVEKKYDTSIEVDDLNCEGEE